MKSNFHQIFQETQIKRICQQCQLSSEKLQKLLQNPIVDKMLGSLFGCFIGDALGSYLPPQQTKISEDKLKNMMKMPGGGQFKNLPGQMSDYSEMSLELISSLLIYNKEISLKDQITSITILIAYAYSIWLKTRPQNPDETNSCGIQNLSFNIEDAIQKQAIINGIKQGFTEVSIQGKGYENNSSLVRIIPLAIFLAVIKKHKPEQQLYCLTVIKNQMCLTHSNKITQTVGLQWTQLISNLILRQKKLQDLVKIYNDLIKNNKFKDWKKQSQQEKISLSPTYNMNWIKIIYVYSLNKFKQIVNNYDQDQDLDNKLFLKYLKKIIQMGGNQTANACIFGGLLGSIVGFNQLPKEYLQKMMKVKYQNNTVKKRPSSFEPINGFINVIKLIEPFENIV